MVRSRTVKLVVRVKLLPTPEQASALEATLHAVNVAATRVSAVAFDKFGLRCRETPLRRLCVARQPQLPDEGHQRPVAAILPGEQGREVGAQVVAAQDRALQAGQLRPRDQPELLVQQPAAVPPGSRRASPGPR